MRDPMNAHVAALLEETAALLEQQNASVFRVGAYRRAAEAQILEEFPDLKFRLLDRQRARREALRPVR